MKDICNSSYNSRNQWLDNGKSYIIREGYKWIKGQFETV